MRRADPTRVKDGGRKAWCSVCGEETALPTAPVKVSVWAAAAKAFIDQHAGCAEKLASEAP